MSFAVIVHGTWRYVEGHLDTDDKRPNKECESLSTILILEGCSTWFQVCGGDALFIITVWHPNCFLLLLSVLVFALSFRLWIEFN